MERENKFWLVRDKRRLLLAMMESLAGGAHISFEGDLSALRLSDIPVPRKTKQVRSNETPSGRNKTLWSCHWNYPPAGQSFRLLEGQFLAR